ncbi:sensor histidine kinase [Cohnella sp. 56]|uniref:sensor histidine kinase n=1 Tax=Cohnella sp. 56 TaxID=3113722 RepID=UPI0030E85694
MFQRDIFRNMLLAIVSLLLPTLGLLFYSNETGIAVVEREIKASSYHKLSFLRSQLDAQIYQLNANMLTMVRDVEAMKYATRFEEDPYARTLIRSELEKKLLLLSITSPWTNRIALYAPQTGAIVASDGKEWLGATGAGADANADEGGRTGWPLAAEPQQPGVWRFEGEPGQPSTWTFIRRMADVRTDGADGREPALVVESSFAALSLQSMLDQYKAGSSGNPLLWLPDSGIAVGSRGASASRMEAVTRSLRASLLDRDDGAAVVELDEGGKYMTTSLYIDALRAYLIDYVPLGESLAPISRQRSLFYLVSALMLATAALAAILLYRNVRVPIRRLVDGVQRIRRGDYGSRIHDRASSEFEYLYLRFNQMAEQIQQLIENVYEERIRTKDATLKQLQSQINPHFLYNCFAHIIHMSEMGNQEGVTAMSHNLSDYFRYTTRADKGAATLAEEVMLVVNYLEIQKMRLSRLDYRIDMPAELAALPLPRLLLQPLVENAVVHGIEPYARRGMLVVAGERDDEGYVRLCVSDSGAGLADDELAALAARFGQPAAEGESYGLYNVHHRLQLTYGPAAGLSFGRAPEGGLQATIVLPPPGSGTEERDDPGTDR